MFGQRLSSTLLLGSGTLFISGRVNVLEMELLQIFLIETLSHQNTNPAVTFAYAWARVSGLMKKKLESSEDLYPTGRAAMRT